MMPSPFKTIVLIGPLVLAGVCTAGCSSSASNEAKSSSRAFSASPVAYQSDPQFQNQIMRDELKRASVKLHLGDLQQLQLGPTDTETRIWVGFGLLVPRCFVVKHVNGMHQAQFLTIQRFASTPIHSRRRKAAG